MWICLESRPAAAAAAAAATAATTTAWTQLR